MHSPGRGAYPRMKKGLGRDRGMKRKLKISGILFLLAAAGLLLLFSSCAEPEPEETEPKETVQPEFDIEFFREEYEKREDQQGYVPRDSKYGFDLPEIRSWTDGFEDYLGYSVILWQNLSYY